MKAKLLFFLIALLLIFLFLMGQSPQGTTSTLADVFLKKSALWEGSFNNYVNKNGGIVQSGRYRMEVRYEDDQTIKWRINLMNKGGQESGYTGYSMMKINGKNVEWVGEETVDKNTKNRVEDHVFQGFLLDDHLYIHEAYAEVYPDGKKEKRRNDLHFILLDDGRILQTADVFLDDKLLVFAHTILQKKEADH